MREGILKQGLLGTNGRKLVCRNRLKNMQKVSLQKQMEKAERYSIQGHDTKYYDPGGNYFRIRDNMSQSNKRQYVRLDGSPIPFNIRENGKERGVTQDEYNRWSHFLNTDQLKVR